MEKMRKCPKCGKFVSQYTYFCTECGTKTEECDEQIHIRKETTLSMQEKEISDMVLNDKEEIGITNVQATAAKNNSGVSFSKKTIGGITVVVLIGLIGVIRIFSIEGNNSSTAVAQDVSTMENISDTDYEDLDLANLDNEYNAKEEQESSVEDNSSEYAESVDTIEIPDWIIVNGVAVNGNEMCYSRDDMLPTSNGEYPLTVVHYIFNSDGSLYSMKGYMIYENKETASQYVDKLSSYNDKDENEFGMKRGETQYYSVENVLVEEYLPQYTEQYVGTMQDEISMYSRFGITIYYSSSDQMQVETHDEGSLAETEFAQWTTNSICSSYSDYSFLLDGFAQEVITPTFEADGESIVVCTVAELVQADNYVIIDNSRYYYVQLYDATTDELVDYYTGIYDYNEGGVEFFINNIGHSYYLKIITDLEDNERIYGHGHIIR